MTKLKNKIQMYHKNVLHFCFVFALGVTNHLKKVIIMFAKYYQNLPSKHNYEMFTILTFDNVYHFEL